MLRIVTHIERLLLDHDCVIVPKFGGFVLQAIPAVYNAVEHTFRPLCKEVVFNATLQHTDGLLSESYMQMYDVNYRKAQLMLEEDIEDLKYSLLQYKKFSLGELGAFSVGNEGQVIFYPGNAESFSIHSYGLPIFHFPVLQPLQSEQEEIILPTGKKQGKKDTLYIPINRRLVRTVAASAAAAILFLLVSTPVKDVNQAAYTASFIPSEIVSHPVASETTLPNHTVVMVEEVEETSVSVATPTPVAVKTEVVLAEAPRKVEKSMKMYHIVIASFPTELQADEYISGVDKKDCKHVSKVIRDGKYRIYADRFDNREQAEVYMAILRNNEKYKDAWLYISR